MSTGEKSSKVDARKESFIVEREVVNSDERHISLYTTCERMLREAIEGGNSGSSWSSDSRSNCNNDNGGGNGFSVDAGSNAVSDAIAHTLLSFFLA